MKLLYFLVIFPFITSPPASVIEWQLDPTQDMGLLKRDVPSSKTFTFKNIAEEPITIDNIRVSCGCTAPTWDLTPILPGELGSFEITFDAKKEGYFYKKIRVFFSGQRRAEIIYIEGEVE